MIGLCHQILNQFICVCTQFTFYTGLDQFLDGALGTPTNDDLNVASATCRSSITSTAFNTQGFLTKAGTATLTNNNVFSGACDGIYFKSGTQKLMSTLDAQSSKVVIVVENFTSADACNMLSAHFSFKCRHYSDVYASKQSSQMYSILNQSCNP